MRYTVIVARTARVYYEYEVEAVTAAEAESRADDYMTYGTAPGVTEVGSTLTDDDDDGYEVIDIQPLP